MFRSFTYRIHAFRRTPRSHRRVLCIRTVESVDTVKGSDNVDIGSGPMTGMSVARCWWEESLTYRGPEFREATEC